MEMDRDLRARCERQRTLLPGRGMDASGVAGFPMPLGDRHPPTRHTAPCRPCESGSGLDGRSGTALQDLPRPYPIIGAITDSANTCVPSVSPPLAE
jgi:hypothetical protein